MVSYLLTRQDVDYDLENVVCDYIRQGATAVLTKLVEELLMILLVMLVCLEFLLLINQRIQKVLSEPEHFLFLHAKLLITVASNK